MDKEIKIVKAGNSKKLQLTVLIPLAPSQYEKMENAELIPIINNIANEFRVDWAIRVNNECKTAEVSTVHDSVTSQIQHDQEIIAIDFMSAVDKLEIPAPEPECPSHENNKETSTTDFVKELLYDLNRPEKDEESVIGAQVLCYGPKECPIPLPWGKMSHDLLKEMCELYLATHEND